DIVYLPSPLNISVSYGTLVIVCLKNAQNVVRNIYSKKGFEKIIPVRNKSTDALIAKHGLSTRMALAR
ncbi:MAG: hypothetical protein V1855_02475, partial [bacterium]